MNILEIDAALAAQDAAEAAARVPVVVTTKRHGSPFDRGSADYYYGRLYRPHYFVGDTYGSAEITDLTDQERAEYRAGWEEADRYGDQKDWG